MVYREQNFRISLCLFGCQGQGQRVLWKYGSHAMYPFPVRFVPSAEPGGLPRSKVRRYCACQPAYRPLDLTTCKLHPTLHWSRQAAASSWCNRICFLVACGSTVLTGCGKHQLFLLLFHEVTLGVVGLLWVLSAVISWLLLSEIDGRSDTAKKAGMQKQLIFGGSPSHKEGRAHP